MATTDPSEDKTTRVPPHADDPASVAPIAPTVAEAELSREDVEALPAPSDEGSATAFFIVGLGASAGGLAALEAFFAPLPGDTGMAFVVVTHQHPEHRSLLTALLAKKTTMPVIEAERPLVIEPNHVYVSAPGCYLEAVAGTLRPVPADGHARPSQPIDHFLRSLARAHKDRAFAVILSGTGTDGTLGIREIHANFGVVIAQEEQSAAYAGMPQSAIATAVVDFVLPAGEMAAKLMTLQRAGEQRFRAVRTLATTSPGQAPLLPATSEELHALFARIRARTGHDFSQYKENTLRRRIERRMAFHGVASIADYLAFVELHPEDLDGLFKEMLIGVTSFFRDPAAFEALEGPLAALLATRPEGHTVRAWVAGCSTGEEAYSVAILLREAVARSKRSLGIQVFASDLDPDAVTVARAGRYPLGIAADVPPELLARCFCADKDGYRVRKEVRDTIIFAHQNVTADPPFTRLDLIVCRNLLIYFNAALQLRLLPTFHYALSAGGILFLGSSETMSQQSNLFEPVDKKWRIYRRQDVPDGRPGRAREEREALASGFARKTPPAHWIVAATPALGDAGPTSQGADRLLLRELVPPTVICRERGEIVHVHGRVGRFLELAPGPQAVQNVFSMVRGGLELELGTAIRQASARDGEVVRRDVRVDTNGHALLVDLRVRLLREPDAFRGLYLVTFDHARALDTAATAPPLELEAPPATSATASRLHDLAQELEYAKESHRATIIDLATANEELKSNNEELISMNEELQSANEELETSREEMQSLNEELHTVNAELQCKVEELWRTTDDMKNLLNATDIATLFLDDKLCIKRYTEQTKRVIPIIASDVGRPIADLVPRLQYDRLAEDAGEVLATLIPKERESRGVGDAWYLVRILPYRTNENVIDGLVVTFVDVTKLKALQRNEQRFLAALEHSPTAVFGQDSELRYVWTGTSVFGRPADALVGLRDEDLLPAAEAATLTALKRAVLESGTPARHWITLTPAGHRRVFDLYLEPIRDERGTLIGVSGVATAAPERDADEGSDGASSM